MCKLYQRKGVINFISLALVFLLSFPVTFAAPNLSSAFATLYKLMLPIAILIGLVLIAINGYGIMTSDGDPRKVQESKEGLFSAIMGLAFVILAIVIYRVIVTSLIPSDISGGRPF
jgi:hypothetical protein